MGIKTANFFNKVLSSKDTTSSKRLITLIISLHFILASFVILFIAFYVIFYLPKGKIEPELIGLLKQVLEYDFYIILSGLGFITVDGATNILLEQTKYKTSVAEKAASVLQQPKLPTAEEPAE